MNPKNDYVFKRIFGHKGNEEITKKLLNSILLDKVKSLSVDEDTILEKDLYNDKVGILDVKVKFDDNTYCDLEMQIVDKKNIEKRILDYWSMTYQRSISEGEDYSCLKKCIIVLFLDYDMEVTKEIPEYLTIWNIREKNYPEYILTKDLEFYIIEMSKYEDLKNEKKMNPWIEFINNPEVDMENDDIKEAKNILDNISQDKRERRLAELRKKYIADQKAIEMAGYDKGKKARN